jgi:hypothetical protein
MDEYKFAEQLHRLLDSRPGLPTVPTPDDVPDWPFAEFKLADVVEDPVDRGIAAAVKHHYECEMRSQAQQMREQWKARLHVFQTQRRELRNWFNRAQDHIEDGFAKLNYRLAGRKLTRWYVGYSWFIFECVLCQLVLAIGLLVCWSGSWPPVGTAVCVILIVIHATQACVRVLCVLGCMRGEQRRAYGRILCWCRTTPRDRVRFLESIV